MRSTAQIDMEPGLKRSFTRNLLRWWKHNRRQFPWREETDPFRVLVAEVLLQRSRSSTVEGVYEELFRRWPSAKQLARADVADIEAVIRPLGLVRRARFIKKLAAEIVERGEVPRTTEDLVRLAGVGRYAAAATSAVAFRRRAAVVDGTSARVYRRFFGLRAARDSQVDSALWELVEEVTPRSAAVYWNWAVLDLAASICLPRVPRCPECPLKARCHEGRRRIQPSVAEPG